MSDFRYCAGTFAMRTTTGSQTVTGVSDADGTFTPKAVILFTTLINGSGFQADGIMAIGVDDATTHLGVGTFKGNNETGTRGTRSGTSNGAAIRPSTTDPTVRNTQGLVSAFADGSFTVDWTQLLTASDATIGYLAMGGADLQAKVGVALAPQATGNQAVTGVGIGQLTGLILLMVGATDDANLGVAGVASDQLPTLGWTDGTNQGANWVWSGNFLSTTNTWGSQRTARTAMGSGYSNQAGTPTNIGNVTITSLDADGFTINWLDSIYPGPLGTGNRSGLYYLAISGPQVQVGSFVQSDRSVSMPFRPGAVIVSSVGAIASTSPQAGLQWSIGVVGAGTSVNSWIGDLTAQTTSAATSALFTNQIVMAATPNVTPGSTTTQAAANALLTDDGMQLEWSAADATARQSIYFALEGAAVTPYEPSVGVETDIRWLRRGPNISDVESNTLLSFPTFELLAQMGQGNTNDPGLDPLVTLRWSNDGAQTWSNEHVRSLGPKGQFKQRAVWRQTGQARIRAYEVSGSDPTFVGLIDALVDVSKGSGS